MLINYAKKAVRVHYHNIIHDFIFVRQWINCRFFFLTDGLNFPSDDHLLGTSVKQEPLSDDDGHSEVGYVFDRENDTFDEEDTFINSNY